MGKKRKRLLSLLLAILMVLSSSMTAFATETQESQETTGPTEGYVAAETDVAYNTTTLEGYDNLQEALHAAKEGQTIAMVKDVQTTLIMIPEKVTLDLNGWTLDTQYVTCYGDLVDLDDANGGLLKVAPKRILIKATNAQMPVKTEEGYKFYTLEKWNVKYVADQSKYAFQPLIEADAHELLLEGAKASGVTLNVRVSWKQKDGVRSQDFVYSDTFVTDFLNSYNAETGKYGRMFTLTLNGTEGFEDLSFCAVMVSESGVEQISEITYAKTEEVPDESESESETETEESSSNVTTDENNQVTDKVTIGTENASAVVSEGTQLEANTTALTLKATDMETTTSDVELGENEEMRSLDVHVEGVAANNTVPVIITLDEIAPEFLNQGNIRLYHVENGVTTEMTRVFSIAEVDEHNEYYYDIETGTLTVAMATFSEVAVVSDNQNAWKGEFDYSWYNKEVTTVAEGEPDYVIANADQLAAFGAIVGGMNGQTQDSFAGKTVKLIADINLGDKESENNPDLIFYPIGYYNSTGKYTRTSDSITSNVSSFSGTFDGNGHTISNFYQNTWEMFGDYNDGYSAGSNYYKDAMGLFGYVANGKIKNLTVDNFSSDGEFTPTGVIAAYAMNSTFENIAITNCNPRVYNTGNGGIVGIGGNSDDPDTYKLTFNNITIDNTNKITALWGSWDVACGGLVGMFRGAGHVHMTNCHVAAQIDVYNDVCGNYQYYWYRYSGMLVGTNKNMTTENGKTKPETEKFHATDCTVHFGEWNDYYYCELVANSLASYTHDHQFSRLEQVDSVDIEKMTVTIGENTTAIPTSGRCNYVVVNGEASTENAICYHFVNGAVWNHEDAGEETVDVDGDGVKETVLKEDRQHYYLPFNQLFTGYGWGVEHVPIYDDGTPNPFAGVTILGREVADSVVKFEKTEAAKDSYTTGATVKIGELFTATDAGLAEKTKIDNTNVQVTVSPVGDDSTAGGEYVANTTDWTQGTLEFTGIGAAQIIITDYNYCEKTVLNVTIKDKQAIEKFESKFTGDFLYRVGNQNAIKLDSLFKAKDGAEIGNVSVTVDTVYGASGTYTSNATWTNGTIQFSGTGVVKVTITDNDNCVPTELILEVVDAVNATTATSATANNVVLLNDISSGFTVSGRYAVYGNGFTLNYTGNGQYLNNGLKQGVVTVSENGTLDNLRIVASIYPSAYLYYGSNSFGEAVQDGPKTVDGDKTRYYYQLSAVAATGNATISNCYIYGGRNNIFVNTGDVTITDSILECGVVANVQIQSNSSHTVTFNNVTTIQHQVNPTMGDTSLVMLGAGVLVGPETSENPTIVLDGEFKQYNWVTKEDKSAVSNTMAQAIIQGALDATAYNHTVNEKTASNLGIIYMNTYAAVVTNNTGLPYVLGDVSIKVSGNTISGKVCSLQNALTGQIYSDNENADKSTNNSYYEPQFKYSTDLGGQYIEKTEDGDEHCYREGDTIHVMFPSGDEKELDLAEFVNIAKYSGQNLGLEVTCKDENGNEIAITDGKVSLSAAGEYTVKYTVTDTLFYDKDGKTVIKEVEYSWDITVSVSLKDTAVPDAYFEFDSTKQIMGYAKKSLFAGGNTQYLPFLAGLKIYDYNGQTSYLRFDGDNDFNKIASATITGYTSANHVLIEVKLTDGGVINIDTTARAASGGSTYTGKIQTSENTIYYVNDGTTSATTTTWVISSYKFTGNNGVEINSGAVTFSNCTNGSVPTGSFSTTIKYTVTYDANEGNCGQTTGYATSVATAVTLPTPTRSGYMFTGWYTAESGGEKVGDAGTNYTPTANTTLYAQWGKPSTVTYNANGGAVTPESEKYTGTALTLPTPTRDGYWFTGWYDAAEGGNKIGAAGAIYQATGDITLYAQWSPVYTVTYNANGGSVTPASAKYEGTALTLPIPTREGYAFNGWYTAVSGGTKIGDAGVSYIPNADVTLYAQWKDPVTVTYNANGGSCSTTSQTYLGTTLTLPTPTRSGYNFTGWYDAASGGTKVGDAGDSYTPSANITLYAQWTGCVVTLDENYNSGSKTTMQYAGSALTLPTATRSNYTFNGWYTATSGGTKIGNAGASYTPTADITLYAQWTYSGGCITPDTLITLADGTQKRIDQLTYNDTFTVWDFVNGEYTTTTAAIINNHGLTTYIVTTLNFEDGTTIRTIDGHGFYHKATNEFIMLDDSNVAEYVGHEFLKEDMTTLVKLVDYNIAVEEVESWSILTAEHYNAMLNGMFTLTPGEVKGSEKYLMPFKVNDDLKYDEEARLADIETYGLYVYEDFSEYVTYEQFQALNLPIFKVSVGKGHITYEDIVFLLKLHCN